MYHVEHGQNEYILMIFSSINIESIVACMDLYLLLFFLHINLACLSVCLYPINVKTAEPIGPKFFVGHHVTTGKVYE